MVERNRQCLVLIQARSILLVYVSYSFILPVVEALHYSREPGVMVSSSRLPSRITAIEIGVPILMESITV